MQTPHRGPIRKLGRKESDLAINERVKVGRGKRADSPPLTPRKLGRRESDLALASIARGPNVPG